jgi:hypothetical protein
MTQPDRTHLYELLCTAAALGKLKQPRTLGFNTSTERHNFSRGFYAWAKRNPENPYAAGIIFSTIRSALSDSILMEVWYTPDKLDRQYEPLGTQLEDILND